MRAVFAAAAAVAALVFTNTAFGGSQKDRDDCARKGDPDRRIPVCTRLIEDRSEARYNLAAYYNNRGGAWRLKGDFDRAIADCNEAIRLDPKSATAYNRRGVAWRRKGDFEHAIADYTTAIRLDPNNAQHANRGLAYFGKGDFSAAAADFRPSIESKNAAYLILFRYLARARAGESTTAEFEANAARLKSKEWPFAAIELHLGLRTPDVTLDAANNADARCEAQFYIGEWHLLRGDQASAKSALQIAVDTCPKDFVEYFMAVAELKRLTP